MKIGSSHQRCSIKSCLSKFRNIHKKAPVLESLFNKSLKACNFSKKRIRHRCFPVNTAKFSRTIILKNICKRLFLENLQHLDDIIIKSMRAPMLAEIDSQEN